MVCVLMNMVDLYCRYDIVDVTRNSLQILAIKYYTDLVYSFGRGDIHAVE